MPSWSEILPLATVRVWISLEPVSLVVCAKKRHSGRWARLWSATCPLITTAIWLGCSWTKKSFSIICAKGCPDFASTSTICNLAWISSPSSGSHAFLPSIYLKTSTSSCGTSSSSKASAWSSASLSLFWAWWRKKSWRKKSLRTSISWSTSSARNAWTRERY